MSFNRDTNRIPSQTPARRQDDRLKQLQEYLCSIDDYLDLSTPPTKEEENNYRLALDRVIGLLTNPYLNDILLSDIGLTMLRRIKHNLSNKSSLSQQEAALSNIAEEAEDYDQLTYGMLSAGAETYSRKAIRNLPHATKRILINTFERYFYIRPTRFGMWTLITAAQCIIEGDNAFEKSLLSMPIKDESIHFYDEKQNHECLTAFLQELSGKLPKTISRAHFDNWRAAVSNEFAKRWKLDIIREQIVSISRAKSAPTYKHSLLEKQSFVNDMDSHAQDLLLRTMQYARDQYSPIAFWIMIALLDLHDEKKPATLYSYADMKCVSNDAEKELLAEFRLYLSTRKQSSRVSHSKALGTKLDSRCLLLLDCKGISINAYAYETTDAVRELLDAMLEHLPGFDKPIQLSSAIYANCKAFTSLVTQFNVAITQSAFEYLASMQSLDVFIEMALSHREASPKERQNLVNRYTEMCSQSAEFVEQFLRRLQQAQLRDKDTYQRFFKVLSSEKADFNAKHFRKFFTKTSGDMYSDLAYLEENPSLNAATAARYYMYSQCRSNAERCYLRSIPDDIVVRIKALEGCNQSSALMRPPMANLTRKVLQSSWPIEELSALCSEQADRCRKYLSYDQQLAILSNTKVKLSNMQKIALARKATLSASDIAMFTSDAFSGAFEAGFIDISMLKLPLDELFQYAKIYEIAREQGISSVWDKRCADLIRQHGGGRVTATLKAC